MTEDTADVARRRRAAMEKALGRAEALGIKVDADPRYSELLQSWINGEITMKEARNAYLRHVRERDQGRADWRALGISSAIAKAKAALLKAKSRE
ncbi:hypothetical protein [Rhizobium sp. Rhizsp82]|uniref:hypothetical protein n=1 Tax=Rhizobium sp. Rhizsp82 TaxID=3243057 RepID=UPI0039B3EC26